MDDDEDVADDPDDLYRDVPLITTTGRRNLR
jgi:hypothetical protein